MPVKRIMFIIGILCVTALVLQGCFKDITKKREAYANNFDDRELKGFKIYKNNMLVAAPMLDTFNGSITLGPFNNTLVELLVDNLPIHNAVEVSFDLYVHDQWQGDHTSSNNVPDLWIMRINDSLNLITTFSNTQYTQTYPNWYIGAPASPARANSWNAALPGFCSISGRQDGSSQYKIVQTFLHTKQSFKIALSDALQGDLCTKSWSIDNFQVKSILY